MTFEQRKSRLIEHLRRVHGFDHLAAENHYVNVETHERDHDEGAFDGSRWQHDIQDWYLEIDEP